MNPEKIEEIILKFKNGKSLYRTSAPFNKMVHFVANGGAYEDVIEALIISELIND